ncbi:hypothetical protein COB52_00780 [Candidatus Kaiserbacteria bacterium]|nr:MAG: hypothetical protein COB52_00780 [Candidatus Kaiserbacteria bacterium]
MKGARDWIQQKADSVHARIWLVILSFTESSVFVIPPDPLLATMVFLNKKRWIRYTVITAGASVAGAVFGYVIGAILYDTVGIKLIELYSLQEHMIKATELIEKGVFVFTLTMAFTPIPFKVAVLSAGFTKANFMAFFIATVGGRFARYFLVAYVAKVFGDNGENIMKKIWWFATLAGIFVITAVTLYIYLF